MLHARKAEAFDSMHVAPRAMVTSLGFMQVNSGMMRCTDCFMFHDKNSPFMSHVGIVNLSEGLKLAANVYIAMKPRTCISRIPLTFQAVGSRKAFYWREHFGG